MGIWKLIFHHHHTKFYKPRARATPAAGVGTPKGHPRAEGVQGPHMSGKYINWLLSLCK